MQEQQNEFEMAVSHLSRAEQRHAPGVSRLLRAALVAMLVGLVVLLLLAGTVGQGQLAALRARFSSAPTAILPAADTVINVVHWAPWGTLLANGHPVAQLSAPSNQLGQQLNGAPTTTPYVTSFVLPRGHYTLEYHADPFPVVHCAISVPAARGDDCPLAHGDIPDAGNTLTPGARMLDLHAAPEYLANSKYVALVNAVRQLFATSYSTQTYVEPGEHYLDAQGQVAIAREPLLVTADFGLRPDADSPSYAHTCDVVCAAPLASADYLRSGDNLLHIWMGAAAQARMTYRYANLSGQAVLDHAPALRFSPLTFQFPVALSWQDGKWYVAAQTFGMQVDVCPLIANDPGLYRPGAPASSVVIVPGPTYPLLNWLDGCVVKVSSAATGRDGVVPLLYRFGVVLALSRQAQQAFPNLPVPDAYEQQLAARVYTG